MRALSIVVILATSVSAAQRYEVVNQGDEVEVRQLPDMPEPTPLEREERSFFSDAPPIQISPLWGPAELAEALIASVRADDRARLLNRLGEVKPRNDKDLRGLLNLYSREDSAARLKVEASLARLSPDDAGLAPFFRSLLEDEEPVFQIFGLLGAARVRDARSNELVRALAEKPFPAPEPSFGLSPADANRWTLQYNALRVLAEWEGEKALPLVLKRSKEAPGVAEIAAVLFWEKSLPDFVTWSESRQAEDRDRAAKAWAAPVPRAALSATKARLWELALDRRLKVETRHRAAIKLGVCAEEADVDRLLAERAKAEGKARALLDAGLFASRHPKAVPVLTEYAKTSADPVARAGAMFQLRSMLPFAEYRELLRWAAKNDPDPENRANAAAELRTP